MQFPKYRRRGRHHAGRSHAGRAGTAALLTIAVAATVGAGGLAQPTPAQASTAHPLVFALRYVPHTILCARWQAGADGLVYGDGRPFEVVCEPIHPPRMYGWDAESWGER